MVRVLSVCVCGFEAEREWREVNREMLTSIPSVTE